METALDIIKFEICINNNVKREEFFFGLPSMVTKTRFRIVVSTQKIYSINLIYVKSLNEFHFDIYLVLSVYFVFVLKWDVHLSTQQSDDKDAPLRIHRAEIK